MNIYLNIVFLIAISMNFFLITESTRNSREVTCKQNEWRCSDKRQCIPINYLCNKYNDCIDASDEKPCNCKKTSKTSIPPLSSTKKMLTTISKYTSKVTSKPFTTKSSKLTSTTSIFSKSVTQTKTLHTTITSTTNLRKCGRPAIQPSTSNTRIIGGVPAIPHSWPWHVAIHIFTPSQLYYKCGGSIINETIILTAAHCFNGVVKYPDHYRITAGDHNITTSSDEYAQLREIKEIIMPDGYLSYVHRDDIAILVLKTPLVFNTNISAICLPFANITSGENCYATGWGFTKVTGSSPTILNQVRLPYIDQDVCLSVPDPEYQKVTVNDFCAGYLEGGKDACNADSGGPYTCQKEDKTWYLDGITAWGQGCAEKDQPGVYTRVFSYVNWIVAKTGFHF